MSGVLLGVCDLPIPDDAIIDAKTNKIGGKPNWYGSSDVERLSCKTCGRCLVLVLQLYCPLDGSVYHRTLYIFVCPSKTCSSQQNGWKVIRCQEKDMSYKQEKPSSKVKTISKDTWCDDADDWGMDSNEWGSAAGVTELESGAGVPEWGSSTGVTDFESATGVPEWHSATGVTEFESATGDSVNNSNTVLDNESLDEKLSELTITDPVCSALCIPEDTMNIEQSAVLKYLKSSDDGQEVANKDVDVLVSYYLGAVEEPDIDEFTDKHVTHLIHEYSQREGVDVREIFTESTGKGGGGSEKYEKPSLNHGDEMFHKFTRRISRCTQQCLRYSWSGDPLFITKSNEDLKMRCAQCHGELVYELQLMPALIPLLKSQNSTDCIAEFGTVLIYTCRNSCWNDSDSFREEKCILQLDPDFHLFKT